MSKSQQKPQDKNLIGSARSGQRIIWHNDPSGPREIVVKRQANHEKKR